MKQHPLDRTGQIDGQTTRRLRKDLRDRGFTFADVATYRKTYAVPEGQEDQYTSFHTFVHEMADTYGIHIHTTIQECGGERHLLEPAIDELRVYYRGRRKFLRTDGLDKARHYLIQKAAPGADGAAER